VLHANSQILNPAGAGNLFRRGQGIFSRSQGSSWVGQGIRPVSRNLELASVG
jgi:hypothetical protein